MKKYNKENFWSEQFSRFKKSALSFFIFSFIISSSSYFAEKYFHFGIEDLKSANPLISFGIFIFYIGGLYFIGRGVRGITPATILGGVVGFFWAITLSGLLHLIGII